MLEVRLLFDITHVMYILLFSLELVNVCGLHFIDVCSEFLSKLEIGSLSSKSMEGWCSCDVCYFTLWGDSAAAGSQQHSHKNEPVRLLTSQVAITSA